VSAHPPEVDKHLALADRNRDLAITVRDHGADMVTPPPYDWVIVMAFYAALHYVNAHYWRRMEHKPPTDHQARNGYVNKTTELQSIAPMYNQLYSASRIARYDIGPYYRKTATDSAIEIANAIDARIRAMI